MENNAVDNNKFETNDAEYGRVYGKDRATGAMAEDPIIAANSIEKVNIHLSDTNESASDSNEVSMLHSLPSVSSSACTSNKKKKVSDSKVQKSSKKAKVATGQNVESEHKKFNDEIRGFLKNMNDHYETMSNWMQGTSSRMSQVLEVLDKHGFSGTNKYKAAKAICQDALNVDLLFSLDPTEIKDYVFTLI